MSSHVNMTTSTNVRAYDGPPRVIILEQPSSKGLRFRYECEKKYAAAIVGVNSKANKKTFPTIKIVNWKGPVRVVVSCVTKDPPYRPHPHNLLGKKKVADGICRFELGDAEPALCFENLSVQCVKKKDVERSLALREKLGVDPFKTGFDHATKPNSLDLYSLRLCIQVFLEGKTRGVFDVPLQPVVTDPINDRRSKSEPEIVYITREEGPVTGGEDLGILCERVDRDDVDVLFYREESNWQEIAQFHKLGVFKRVAIVIKTPAYGDEHITEPVEVKILLRKRSTGDVSDSFSYTYLPGKINPLKRKRDQYTYTQCESLQKVLEKNADKVLPKNINSCEAYNLPARESKGNDDRRELQSVADLSANACEYSDLLGSITNNLVPKNKTSNNLCDDDENANGPKDYSNSLNSDDWIHELLQTIEGNSKNKNKESEIAKEPEIKYITPEPVPNNANGPKDEQQNWNYSNTDDWIHELFQTIEGDSKNKNKESEIVKEPEIKYITPEPVPNITNSIPAIQSHTNFIGNNNNHQGTPSINVPVFMENVQHLPQYFARDLNTLPNIQKQREQPPVGIPQGYLMHGQHPQYAVNINGNQGSNVLNNVTNRQPLMSNNYQHLSAQQAYISQMCVDNNFNGHSGNYTMNNGAYGTPMQSFNQENTWHQIQRETLEEFDPRCPTSETWRSNQQFNGFTQ